MKTLFKTLSLSLLIALSSSINGQTWIDEGAVWHYEWSGIVTGGFIRIEYQKDTIINGITCEKLVPITHEFGLTGPNSPITLLGIYNWGPEFTYSNGDTVFYYENGDFHTLYNFGAQVGDTWDLGVDTNGLLCSASIVQVDSIGTININSQNYRWILVSTQAGSSVGLSGKIIERFGNSSPGLSEEGFLFPLMRNCDPGIIADFSRFNFTCFEDSTFSLYNITQNDCEYLLDVGIENEASNIQMDLYPNPADHYIHLIFSKIDDYKIFIYDLNGKMLKQVTTHSKTLDLEIDFLDNGIYFIHILSKSSGSISKKIIKK